MSNIEYKTIIDSIENQWYKRVISDIHYTIVKRFNEESKIVVIEEDTLFGHSNKALDTMEKYKLSDYVTVEDFLKEPTGASEFESDCSVKWFTLKDEIESYMNDTVKLKIETLVIEHYDKDILQNHYDEIFKELLSPTLQKLNILLKKEIPFFIFLAQFKTLPAKKYNNIDAEHDLFENPF